MDATTIAITTDLAGWLLWFALTRKLAQGTPVEQWITVDYYVSTTLLALSTVCTVAGAFLSDPVLVTRVAVPLMLAGLGILALRGWRNTARTVRLQYTSDTQRTVQRTARPQRWTTVTAPPQKGRQQAPQGGRQQAPQGGRQQTPQGGRQQTPQGGRQRDGIYDDPLIRDIEARRMAA